MQSTSVQNPTRFSSSAAYLSAVVLLILSGLLLWLNNLELPIGQNIFYWPLGLNLTSWGKCLTIPLALVCISLWVKGYDKRIVNWKVLASLGIFIVLFLVLVWTHYLFAWGGSSLANVGTANFAGNIYHLARRVQFDERTKYYLGVCTSSGIRCEFHEILKSSSSYDPDHISLEAIQGALLVKAEGEVVYKYDGLQEFCTDTEWVVCPVHSQ